MMDDGSKGQRARHERQHGGARYILLAVITGRKSKFSLNQAIQKQITSEKRQKKHDVVWGSVCQFITVLWVSPSQTPTRQTKLLPPLQSIITSSYPKSLIHPSLRLSIPSAKAKASVRSKTFNQACGRDAARHHRGGTCHQHEAREG